MLQTDPNKRLSLAKVLKDEWMRKGSNKAETTIPTPSSQSNRLAENGCIEWNEHVLQIMKTMNLDVEQAKQVSLLILVVMVMIIHTQAVINKEYSEIAAIYYMLVEQHRTNKLTANIRRHSSVTHMQPVVPQINVVADSNTAPTINAIEQSPLLWNDSPLDPTSLERYLSSHRHTLGPVHNQGFIPSHVMPIATPTQQGGTNPMMSVGGAGQLAVRGANRRTQRRKSDGTASLLAYHKYQQQRGNPQLGPIAGSGIFGGVAGGSSNALMTSEGGGAGSIKEGLEDLSNLQKYGRLSSTHRMYYNLQPTGGGANSARMIHPMEQQQGIGAMSLLQAQCKPFQDVTPTQLQQMLQELNLQNEPHPPSHFSTQSSHTTAATPFANNASCGNTIAMETMDMALRHQPHSMGLLLATNNPFQPHAAQLYTHHHPGATAAAAQQEMSYLLLHPPSNGQYALGCYHSNQTSTPQRKPGTHLSPELHANMITTLRQNNVSIMPTAASVTASSSEVVAPAGNNNNNHSNGDNGGQQLERLLQSAGIPYHHGDDGTLNVQHKQAEVKLHIVQGAVQLVHVAGSAEQYQQVCNDLRHCLTSSA